MKPYKACSCRHNCPGLKIKTATGERWNPNHGKWYIRYEAPRTADEKRVRPRLGPFDTAKEAAQAAADVVGHARTHGHVTDRKITVEEHLDRMLDQWRVEWRPGTVRDAEFVIELYWKPGIGHIRLAALTQHDIRAVHNAMRKINRDETNPTDVLRRLIGKRYVEHGVRRNRRPVSEARIKRVHAVLHIALAAAKDILPVNPASGFSWKHVGKVKPLEWTDERVAGWRQTGQRLSPVMVWTPEQTGRFLDHVADDQLHPLWHLAAYWGLRRGELVRLTWPDVRIEARKITVRDAKTDAGDRDILIDAETARVLKEHRKAQLADRLAWGPGWIESGRVFTREGGSALDPSHVTYRFGYLAEEAGLPPVRFHDLRHGTATMLIAAGVPPKVVQEILGHASVAFTLDVYAVVAGGLAERAAEAMAAFIPRKGTGS